MVNQVVLAVGVGLIAGLIVIATYFLVQFCRLRSSTGDRDYKYDRLISDPGVRSRAIIQKEIPTFYLPSHVPIAIQQPVREERADSLLTDDYHNGQCHLSSTVHSVYVGKKDDERVQSSIQLNAINTGSISTPKLTQKFPRKLSPTGDKNTPKSPRKLSPKQQLPSFDKGTPKSPRKLSPKQVFTCDISTPSQHRKVAVHKKKPDSNLGKLEFSVYYDKSFRLLQIYVTCGIKISSPESDSPPDALVIATLSLLDKQIWEQKTQTVKKSRDPQFNEKLEAHGISTAKLQESALHFQLFDDRSNKIIGEVDFALKDLPANKLINQTLPLSPVEIEHTDEELEDEVFKAPSTELGELLISLCHNPTDQKLSCKISCARALQPVTKDGKANPFVKLDVTFCGKKCHSQSTKVIHRTVTPNFNEAFLFDMHKDKLPQTTLVFKVKHRGRVRDVGLGLVHLGYCVNVESEYKHWEQVMEKPHLEIQQWHALQNYDFE